MSEWQDAIRTFVAQWQGLGFLLGSALRIVGIVIGAWVLIVLAQRGIRGLRLRIASRLDDREAVKRAETLGRVFRYLAAVVISALAGILVPLALRLSEGLGLRRGYGPG